MSYVALYRKFRPAEFDEVKGQEHIVTTLQNQIKTDRIGHAYLFTGTRGTGKTTVAKIFAKAVNCENPVDGSPCGTCRTCQAIAAGNSMNVIEIDAASNNGVGNIRDIIEEVAYPPTEGRYKVYIIDEVHMLSIGAFNALLKTLEEPPEYVIFILATTEVHKIPITILSRCQRYDFHRITIDTIAARLTDLMARENIEVEEKAINYIAKAADGSMRDALSLLDQCIAFYIGQTLTFDNVLKVLGAIDTEVFSKMLRYIIAEDVTSAINLLEEIIIQGRDLSQFVGDFIWYLRNLLLVKSSKDLEDSLEMSSDNLALLKEEASQVSDNVVVRYIHIFSELSGDIKYAVNKRVLIEIALIKLCRPQMQKDIDSILDRVEQLERKIARGIAVTPIVATAGDIAQPVVKKALPDAIPEDIMEAAKNWEGIRGKFSGPLITYIRRVSAVTVSDDMKLQLVVDVYDPPTRMAYDFLEQNISEIEETIAMVCGKNVPVVLLANKSEVSGAEAYTDIRDVVGQFSKNTGIQIEVEEDE